MNSHTCFSNMFDTPPIYFGLNSDEALAFFRKYDILKCVFWIIFNKYQKVCLQFPDELLKDSPLICSMIEERVHQKLYILADTTFGSCCVDYIAAKHVDADAIIHFGYACLNSNNEIPTLYVFPKEYLDINVTCENIISFAKNFTNSLIVLYDVSYSYYADNLINRFAIIKDKIRVSMLAVPQQKKDSVKYSSSDLVINKFNRYYSLPFGTNIDTVSFICLVPLHRRKNFENFVLSNRSTIFYRYSNEEHCLEKMTLPDLLKRSLYEVHKVKEAKRVGILISTLSTDKYLDAINRIKTLCKLTNKLSYIFSVGKISVEKLANFPEIDVFVLIGCPEAEIENKRDFYQPVVGMMEAEMALNNNEIWWQNVVKDYREFLPGGTQYKAINIEQFKNTENEVDISLITNNVISNSAIECDGDITENIIVVRNPLIVTQWNKNYDLNERSWRGLEPNIGKASVEKASIGRTGIPSTGYEYPSSERLT